MKRFVGAGLALVLAIGVLGAPHAEAGLFSKKKPKRTEKPEWMKEPRRFEDTPRMSFVSGVLQQDGWTGWKVGELTLQFAENCRFNEGANQIRELDPGKEVLVMGPRIGSTIVAWSVRVKTPEYLVARNTNPEVRLKPSDANPDCGEIISSPR
ncbi:hypothetical protein KDM41_04265 [bacterium]|nr:hypothetical protein [bacterium]